MNIWIGFLKFAFFVERFVWQNEIFSPSVHFGCTLNNGFVLKLQLNLYLSTPTKTRFYEKIDKSINLLPNTNPDLMR